MEMIHTLQYVVWNWDTAGRYAEILCRAAVIDSWPLEDRKETLKQDSKDCSQVRRWCRMSLGCPQLFRSMLLPPYVSIRLQRTQTSFRTELEVRGQILQVSIHDVML